MISWWIFVIQSGEITAELYWEQIKQPEKEEILVCGLLQGQGDENTEVGTGCPGSFL